MLFNGFLFVGIAAHGKAATHESCSLFRQYRIFNWRKLKDGKDIAVITIGPIGNTAAHAIERAEAEKGLSIAHYDLRFLKPLDEALLHEAGRNFKRIVTIEDGTRKGGMGSAVLEFMADNNYTPHVERIGVPDAFIEHGTVQELHRLCGMDEEGIYNILIKNDE